MKAAFSCWEQRIAPVFDISRRIRLVEVDSGRIVRETQETLPGDLPARKADRLAELGVDALVCGAISRPLHGMVAAYGIRVIPFVAGEVREIVGAWIRGTLRGDAFAMPGCRRCGPRRNREEIMTGKENGTMPGKSHGMGPGRGRGMRRGNGARPAEGTDRPAAVAGPGGTCYCLQCGHRVAHEAGNPCVHRECPRCGGRMGRE